MARELTKRQRTVLDAVRDWIQEAGYPPTIRELGGKLGIKSLRGVTAHLDAIAKKGYLKRDSRARSIRLADALTPFQHALRIPVLGHIRAGEPILAEEQAEDHVVVDGAWVGKTAAGDASQHFALKVQGESMKDAGILEGDYVIVRQQPAADNGQIVVALLGDEATVKRFYREEGRIRLQPENAAMEPIIVDEGESCAVLGRVVAVFRTLPAGS